MKNCFALIDVIPMHGTITLEVYFNHLAIWIFLCKSDLYARPIIPAAPTPRPNRSKPPRERKDWKLKQGRNHRIQLEARVLQLPFY